MFRQVSGSRSSWWVTVFHFLPLLFCFISHLVSCSVFPNTFINGLQCLKKEWSLSPTRILLRRKNNSSHVALRFQICGEKSEKKISNANFGVGFYLFNIRLSSSVNLEAFKGFLFVCLFGFFFFSLCHECRGLLQVIRAAFNPHLGNSS